MLFGQNNIVMNLYQFDCRDSGAEVSEDEEAAPGGGPPLVEAVMATLRRLCSRLLLSPHTDVKHGEDLYCCDS